MPHRRTGHHKEFPSKLRLRVAEAVRTVKVLRSLRPGMRSTAAQYSPSLASHCQREKQHNRSLSS